MLAYEVFQSGQISIRDKATGEPASAGCQIGQQRPGREGVRDEQQGSYDQDTHRTMFSSKSASPSDSPSRPYGTGVSSALTRACRSPRSSNAFLAKCDVIVEEGSLTIDACEFG